MQRQFAIPVFAGALSLCVLGVPLVQGADGRAAHESRRAIHARSSQTAEPVQAPSQAELEARAKELIANQHADDQAIEEYEYVQTQTDRTSGMSPRTLEEKTFRVVPTGTGTLKIVLRSDGKATDPADYRRQLEAWQRVLELALRPNDPREQTAEAKWEKKRRDRAALVDAARTAFVPQWAGTGSMDGRNCDIFELTPNPKFHAHSMLQEALTHFTAKVWVDHDANQIVHAEAHCIRDISVGGGILGKLYRRGVFSFDQVPVAPGIWLPARYQYDFSGRKFLFMFAVHEVVESGHYRRVGPPEQALAAVKSEIAAGKTVYLDP
jgi:hypothetical protein